MNAAAGDLLLVHAAAREARDLVALPAGALAPGSRLLEIGVGKTLAALRLTRELAARRPTLVVAFGVCGAYPARHAVVASPLDVGDACVVGDAVLADEGAAHEAGFDTLAGMRLGDIGPFAADAARTGQLAAALGLPVVRAATVSTCTGTEALSAAIARRSAAHVETMESAAVALVCREFDVPWVEIRCVSNRTGDRTRGGFALGAAADRCQQVVRAALAVLAAPHAG